MFFKTRNHIEECLWLYKRGYRICAIFKTAPERIYISGAGHLDLTHYLFLLHNNKNDRKAVAGVSNERAIFCKRDEVNSKSDLAGEVLHSAFFNETILPWLAGKPDLRIPHVVFDPNGQNNGEGEFFAKLSNQEFIQIFSLNY